jgi:predicted homoserine dehydrogenase-like protein
VTAVRAIEAGHHVVLLTVEADVTVGHQLARRAAEAGVVYTGAAGDEPAATKGLVEFAEVLVDLEPDQVIRWEDVAVEKTPLLAMRREQDRMWGPTDGGRA